MAYAVAAARQSTRYATTTLAVHNGNIFRSIVPKRRRKVCVDKGERRLLSVASYG